MLRQAIKGVSHPRAIFRNDGQEELLMCDRAVKILVPGVDVLPIVDFFDERYFAAVRGPGKIRKKGVNSGVRWAITMPDTLRWIDRATVQDQTVSGSGRWHKPLIDARRCQNRMIRRPDRR